MRKILLPIDPHDTARTRSAIEQAIRMHRDEPVDIRLLMQPEQFETPGLGKHQVWPQDLDASAVIFV